MGCAVSRASRVSGMCCGRGVIVALWSTCLQTEEGVGREGSTVIGLACGVAGARQNGASARRATASLRRAWARSWSPKRWHPVLGVFNTSRAALTEDSCMHAVLIRRLALEADNVTIEIFVARTGCVLNAHVVAHPWLVAREARVVTIAPHLPRREGPLPVGLELRVPHREEAVGGTDAADPTCSTNGRHSRHYKRLRRRTLAAVDVPPIGR